ncbi:sugar ABC transporter substrate-binding protein [Bacillus taeanensis]|uniref:Sugar ABC transporter substrate-binding protein n=1 Tax=Bacillus taeanensis TaxID=273032 RepID=A0A366XWD1_9BACI|nr:sugar ABC transporter substrate-binding protein [Bacillus taeanensis]RBW68453.1 sugar ABC transporter substrate-binding protein [Bacillus taeanensis]
MKKRSIYFLVIFVFTFILLGLVSFADKKPKVVVVVKDLNSEYWKIVKAGAERGFQDFGLDGSVIAPASGTVKEQAEVLENILKEKPDVLIISPIYPPSLTPILDQFVEQNIPVLLVDTDAAWEHKTAYIGTDNFDLGKKAGALLGSELHPGDKVAMIGRDECKDCSYINSPISSLRIKGAKLSLEAIGINIVAEKTDLSNNPILIKKEIEAILQEHPDLKGIMATNDIMALYAFKAMKKYRLTIPITGADGTTKMVELIEEETLPGSVTQNPYDMGYLSSNAALKVMNGKTVEKNIDSGVDIIIKENATQKLEFLKDLLR